MSSYIDDETDKSLKNSMILVKNRNNGIERILKKYDINSRNRQNNELKNLTLIKSDESFDSKIFRSRNSSYDQMSQDSNSIGKRYYSIKTIVKKQSKCVNKHLFLSIDKCKTKISPFSSKFSDKDIPRFELIFFFSSPIIGASPLSPFSVHNSSKENLSKILSYQEETEIISKLKLDIDEFRRKKSIINNEIFYNLFLKKSHEYINISPKSSNIGLQNLKKNPFFIANHFNEINKILRNETLRKFFIRRIRNYIKYIKKNKNDLLVKFEQQEEKEAIFIKEFLEKKQPPFEFSNGGEKKHYQSHSLDFLNFIISKKIIILICRELMKEGEDYLKIVFQFKKYPNYYLELKRALSLL